MLSLCVAAFAPSVAGAAEPAPGALPAQGPGTSAPASGSTGVDATPAPQPSAEALAEAKQRFDRGYELYAEGDYPLALIEFSRAYELVPNYRVLYNIGQVSIQLGQYAKARRALEEYLAKGANELSDERREAVNKDLAMLARRTAFVTIQANVEGAEVFVDDVAVGKTPLGPALLMDAGVHRITVRRRGYLPKTSDVTLAGGDEKSLEVALEPQPEAKQTIVVRERQVVEDNSRTWMIVGWAATGALAAGAVVTGMMGKGEADELEQLRGADSRDYEDLPGRMNDTKKNASALFLASDVMTGAAVIVGGLSLWLTLSPPEPERAGQPGGAPEPKPEVQVGYADGQLLMRGRF